MKQNFQKIINFRHACKVFNPNKKIPTKSLEYILESAHLAPSSFGIEPWKVLVIKDTKLKKELSETCWNHTKIRDCSTAIVLLVRKNLRSTNPYVQDIFNSRMDNAKPVLEKFKEFMDHRSDEEVNCWASRQVYIYSGFFMMAAASIGVDTCPIEGFETKQAQKILNIDTDNYEIAHLIALGYRGYEQPQRSRLELDKIVEYK